MNNETHYQAHADGSKHLNPTLYFMAAVYVLTFPGGFLQDTPYNFVNYILFTLLFIAGVHLMKTAAKTDARAIAKALLYLTGTSTVLLLVVGIGYEWARFKDHQETESNLEGYLYLITLLFWSGIIGSLVTNRRRRARNAH